MKLTDQLRSAVLEAEQSRYRIGLDLDIDAASLSRFVNGTCGLTVANIDKLGEYLGLEIRKRGK